MAPSRPPPSTLPILPGPSQRKQNLACDHCRKRKVRCLRTDKTQICQQCSNKGEECTNNYIDSLAQAKGKKTRKDSNENVHGATLASKRKRKNDAQEASEVLQSQERNDGHVPTHDGRKKSAQTAVSRFDPGETSQQGSLNLTRANSFESSYPDSHPTSTGHSHTVQPIPIISDGFPFGPSLSQISTTSIDTSAITQQKLLNYLFSPIPVTELQYGYTDISSIAMCKVGKSDLWEEQEGKIWYEEPSEAHRGLNEDSIADLVDDLIDTFFSIVQPRYTLLDLTIFKERFDSPLTHTSGALPHTLLAIVLTWGAKFSNHPIILADREECSARDGPNLQNRLRSRMIGLMVIRSREIAESNKIFRIATMENANSCLLLEHLLGLEACHLEPKDYQTTYLSAAVKHLMSMGLNSSAEWQKLQDTQIRNEALSIMWVVRMSDASRAALCRLRPSVRIEDFDIDPVQHAMLSEGAPMTVPLGGSEHNIIDRATWFKIHHTFCSICHTLAKSLWIPSISNTGIPFVILREFIHSSSIWRDKYLSSIGIPTIWPSNWNFLQAITTCTTDCYYHNLWLVVNKAIQDFGIKEEKLSINNINGNSNNNENNSIINGNGNIPGNKLEIENIKRRIKEEAEHAALRIAALTGVLTENGYLKLDPLIINQPIYSAGQYLASLGRSEYLICVAGLRQYSTIFPSLWDQADRLDTIYREVINTDMNIVDEIGSNVINSENNQTQNLWVDGILGIPPRLDLMDSFSDWTGSFNSLNPIALSTELNLNTDNAQGNFNDGNANENENGVSNQVFDGTDISQISNNIHGGGKQPENIGQWLGW